MNPQRIFWLLPVIIISAFSPFVMAKTPVTDTPMSQAEYEPLHTGLIRVNAILFNAPCNLKQQKQGDVILTGCGAGKVFHDVNVVNLTAGTPAILQFYETQNAHFFMRYSIRLVNGDNPVPLPLRFDSQYTLRLEVSYE